MSVEQTSGRESQGLVALLQSLFTDLKILAAQQFQLAVHEVQNEFGRLLRIGASIAGLLVLALTLAVLLGLTGVAALHELLGLSVWASGLLVGAVLVLAIAGLGMYLKQQLGRFRPYPIRTFFTLKEDALWIKEQIASRRT